jgi:hypothetical protein
MVSSGSCVYTEWARNVELTGRAGRAQEFAGGAGTCTIALDKPASGIGRGQVFFKLAARRFRMILRKLQAKALIAAILMLACASGRAEQHPAAASRHSAND